ncbi:MAG: bifunctional methylenetetrahydrofolate dehydrogenase/methenyltetrahydrofolate cyclohydrolase FolD [Candidatus Pacebacteria bacterium]|jgi:methylenetetrahydrofolate dehydrogenase (NADP+)/methenyltetrahydrofolate cyclohydrolase|nr:bifunctional methylenetetrahydrofolate dehydrogenase/methenyltetrahydrofolate cyclohydrolase FolD [Candidatus Paceibacterota bacterium]
MAQLIDGRALSKKIQEKITKEVASLKFRPGLAVVLVGEDPASQIYVKSKERACRAVGFYSEKIVLEKNIAQDKLLTVIKKLNKNPKIHGILVQLPLPKHLDEKIVIDNIDPKKDVDVFHPYNVGELCLKKTLPKLDDLLAPCTPKGVMRMLEEYKIDLEGKKAVVLGRSNLIGKPIALMLLAKNATVEICHSRTKNLAKTSAQADILIAAIGKANFVKKTMVKKGAVVIDVGINRSKQGLVGDVDFKEVEKIAGYITPVPGGVGPMTIACLLENTLLLAKK